MKFIGDLHIHSHYSMATSKKLRPEYLDYWGRIKGITVIGTGDFTHPGWLKELQEKLEPAEPGLFRLKTEYKIDDRNTALMPKDNYVRFLLSAEISNIYKKYDSVRKIHNVILSPDFETAENIQHTLSQRKFNITSDGRPILGMDARDLMEIIMDTNPDNFFIPAHIWTPWFSALGAKSGFNSIHEAFADMTEHIYAVETGLSSDPPMNWMVKSLDSFTLVANSDAHSPEKLGRNANYFNTGLSYAGITESMKTGDPETFTGTIDMFPQEGKYHYAGHRKCGISWDPLQSLKHNYTCPVCGKKVTMGVMNRVVQLSDRENIFERPNRTGFTSIIPLKEMLSEIHNVGPNTATVQKEYAHLIAKCGNEFNILLELPEDEIKSKGSDIIAEAVRRMRNREIIINEGFDGQYGQIKVFEEGEAKYFSHQNSLFGAKPENTRQSHPLLNFDLKEFQRLSKEYVPEAETAGVVNEPDRQKDYTAQTKEMNARQEKAISHFTGPALTLAGPGTGKTRVLTHRIARLINQKAVKPRKILAVTFTNKAAREMQERLHSLLNTEAKDITITTFHALGLNILQEFYPEAGRESNFVIIDEEEKQNLIEKHCNIGKNKIKKAAGFFSHIKQFRQSTESLDEEMQNAWNIYQEKLKGLNAFDIDDLLYHPVKIFRENTDKLTAVREKYRFILVDEYQDINEAQYILIHLLTGQDNQNLFAIGDPNQSIYGFRGADVRFIQRFTEDYPDAEIYRLQHSYRCSDTILGASGDVLSGDSFENDALQGLEQNIKLQIVTNETDKSEAEYIAREIESMMGGLRFFSMDSNITDGNDDNQAKGLNEFAVLTRTKEQLKAFEKAFNDHSIPYEIIGGNSLMQNPTVKNIIRLIKYITGSALVAQDDIPTLQKSELESLTDESAKTIIEHLVSSYYPEFKYENASLYNELLAASHSFDNNLTEFLKYITLGTEVDFYNTANERVPLMTIHAAKGLEFETVFIPGCEDGILPFQLYPNQQTNSEEERRLLYVGMTRAKKYLYLTHAKKRMHQGKTLQLKRSPYLDQIEKQYFESQEQKTERTKPEDTQLNLFD